MAEKFDPSGDRTLGVISKADLCETSLVDYMARSKVNLAKGFIMVCFKTCISLICTIVAATQDVVVSIFCDSGHGTFYIVSLCTCLLAV